MTVADAGSVIVAGEVVSVAGISDEFPEDWTPLEDAGGSGVVEDTIEPVMLKSLQRGQRAYRCFSLHIRTWEAVAYRNIRRDWQ